MQSSTGMRLFLSVAAVCAFGLLSADTFTAESSIEAEKLWDFANGLFIRGKAFYPQAELQYKEFLTRFPDDERVETAVYRLGECYRLQAKYKEAYETYLEHSKFADSEIRDKVNFRTGQVLYQLGKFSDAIKYLEPLYNKELEGDLKEMNAFYYGRTLKDSGKIEEAKKVLMPLAADEKGRFHIFAAYHIASAEMKSEDYEQAIKYYTPVAESDSSLAPEAQFRLGELYLKLKKLDEACIFYKELITKFPDSEYVPYAAYGTIWAEFASGRHDKCIKEYEKFGELIAAEVKPEVLYLVGNCYYETEKYEKAIESYLSIPKLFPDSPFVARARYKTCWSLFMLKEYEQAIAYADSYLEKNPEGEGADKLRFLTGESQLALKNFDKARDQFAQVVEKFPDSIFYRDSLFKLAWCSFQQESYEIAGKNFRLFAEKFPEHERAPEALVRAAESSVSLSKGKIDSETSRKEVAQEAVRDYQAFLTKYKENESREEVLFQLAVLCVDIENSDLAIATFNTLVEEFPDGKHASDAYYWIAREYQKKKEYDRAIPILEKAISTSTVGRFRERARYQLASIYHEQGELDKAADALVSLLTDDPEFEVPQKTHLWLSEYTRGKGKLDEAVGLYKQFLIKHPTSSLRETAYFGLGECYYAMSRWTQAIDSYKKAVELKGPSFREAKVSMGVSYAKAGKHAEARPILIEMSKIGVPELEARALFWLGYILFEEAKKENSEEARTQKFNKARLEFIKVEILYNDSELRPESMFRVAETFELTGDLEEASKQYRKVMDEYPESQFAEQAKKKINLNQSQ